jgi:lambda family phage portal protein
MTAATTVQTVPVAAAKPSLVNRVIDYIRRPAKIDQPRLAAANSRPTRREVLSNRDNLAAAMARYEAGTFGGIDRSWIPHYVQDARQDIDPGQRLEMVRKARYFECNNATMQKILDLIEVNVVGTGVHATPASSDEKWNARALARWQEWCKFADLSSRQNFATLQALMARAQAVDGEIFVWLTYGDPDETGRRFPRIQLIETHRVCDAKLPRQYEQEGYQQFDGILTDRRGRPVFYIVTNDADAFSKSSPKSVALIPAEEIVHIYEPSRTSQPRGLTLFHACLPDLHDLDDLQRYEMLASKDAASRANVVKTASGEVTDDGSIIGREETQPADNNTTAEKVTYYQTAFGARTVVLRHGDEWEQGEALRPTTAQQEFWKILERKVCRGTGLSYAALCDYEGGWSGPALRGALAADNRFYDVRTQTLSVGFQRIYEHVIGADVKPGGALFGGAPKDWRNVIWQSPRRATVDIGRESKSILEELKAGVRTELDVQGELGLDHKSVRDQRFSEVRARIQEAKAISEEFGLPLPLACSFVGLALPQGISLPPEPADPADPADPAGSTEPTD